MTLFAYFLGLKCVEILFYFLGTRIRLSWQPLQTRSRGPVNLTSFRHGSDRPLVASRACRQADTPRVPGEQDSGRW